MGEVLGLGVTHYPPLAGTDEHMADLLRMTLVDEEQPREHSDPATWPESLRTEYGDDGGRAAAADHRRVLFTGFSKVRRALDEFSPDLVVVWGDDQYELFREQCVPAFSVLAYDDMVVRPWGNGGFHNVWDERADTELPIRGARATGKLLTAALLNGGFDMAYSYELPADRPYPHAFLNTILFLDHERRGFPYPILPIAVNCYGSYVITRQGGFAPLSEMSEMDLDPPSPTPARCMDLGAATARFFRGTDKRVALVASSSWSHAFLTVKNWRLYPDIGADRRLFDALKQGDVDAWRAVSLDEVQRSGQQELLNWFCLVGAMAELGRVPKYCDLIETYAFNSNKCFAIF